MKNKLLLSVILVPFLVACCRVPNKIDPCVQAPPHPKQIQREKRIFLTLPKDFSVSPFAPLSPEERSTDWGKEYTIALAFAEDFDLYRAITGFKRALCLVPQNNLQRRLEIEYAITLAYYLGHKYVEVVYAIESTDLVRVEATFPAFSDLLLVLYDSYDQLGKCEHAAHVLKLIEEDNCDHAKRLTLLSAVREADFETLCPNYEKVICGYQNNCKSIRKAQTLNAVLPGAGYWYVGMKKTAFTAFLVNALFIGAGAHLISEGHGAAAAIVLSLEGGWYFGGIQGAGLAAKYYNERLYCSYAEKITQREQLFPLLMLKYTF